MVPLDRAPPVGCRGTAGLGRDVSGLSAGAAGGVITWSMGMRGCCRLLGADVKTGFRDTGLTAACEVVGAVETESGRGPFLGTCPCRQPPGSHHCWGRQKVVKPPTVTCDEQPVAPRRGREASGESCERKPVHSGEPLGP